MATIRGLGRRGVGTLLLAVAIFTALGLRHAAMTQADEEPTKRLLVKCRPADAPAVLAALKGLPVEVWSLDTMQRLSTGVGGKPTPPPTKGGGTLTLPDAALVMQAVQGALAGLTPTAGHLVRLTVQPRRAVLTLWVPDHDALDRIRRALAKEPHLKARGARPNVGAQQPTPSGLQVKVTLAFSPGKADRAAPPAFTGNLALLVAKAARCAGSRTHRHGTPLDAGQPGYPRRRRPSRQSDDPRRLAHEALIASSASRARPKPASTMSPCPPVDITARPCTST